MLAQSPRLPHGRPEPLHQHLARGIPRRDLRREHRCPAHAKEHGEAEDGAEAQPAAKRRSRRANVRRDGDARRLAHRWLRTSTMRGSRYGESRSMARLISTKRVASMATMACTRG